MSIQSEIIRITNNVQDTIDVIKQTGVSVPAGANSGNLPLLAQALANEKQDKLMGAEGQIVGFNGAGEAVAQDAPQAGITQAQADGRYLQLSGGTMGGNIKIPDSFYIATLNGDDFESVRIGDNRIYFIKGDGGFCLYDESSGEQEPAAGFYGLYGDESVILNNIATPTSNLHAANKAYVDSKQPKYVPVTLTASGWSDNAQTVTVQGVLADETAQLIQPVPAIASQNAYYAAGILCTGQAANSLTFTCATVPAENLTVYVVMQEVSA